MPLPAAIVQTKWFSKSEPGLVGFDGLYSMIVISLIDFQFITESNHKQ